MHSPVRIFAEKPEKCAYRQKVRLKNVNTDSWRWENNRTFTKCLVIIFSRKGSVILLRGIYSDEKYAIQKNEYSFMKKRESQSSLFLMFCHILTS